MCASDLSVTTSYRRPNPLFAPPSPPFFSNVKSNVRTFAAVLRFVAIIIIEETAQYVVRGILPQPAGKPLDGPIQRRGGRRGNKHGEDVEEEPAKGGGCREGREGGKRGRGGRGSRASSPH